MIKKKDKIRGLIAQIKDEDVVVRQRASELLGKAGDKGAVSALIKALEDEDWYVRKSIEEFEFTYREIKRMQNKGWGR